MTSNWMVTIRMLQFQHLLRCKIMRLSLIAAMADNRVIGIKNSLPWKLPSDMRWFRQHTLGKPIIMGRKTFESFGGRTLPDRTNIVITRDANYKADGIVVVTSIEQAIEQAALSADNVEEAMIIGGASFYEQMLNKVDRMYLTFVHTSLEGDAWFPEYNSDDWQEVGRLDVEADEKNTFAHSFVVFDRK